MAALSIFGRRTRASATVLTATMSGCLLVSPLGDFENETNPEPPAGNGGTERGGTSSQGGSTSGATGGDEGGAGASGAPSGGSSGSSGSNGTGGSGGSGATGGCSTHQDCVDSLGIVDPDNQPVRCRPSDQKCVYLNAGDCFLTYGDFKDDDAVFLGALVNMDRMDPEKSVSVYPLRLAIKEFNTPGAGDDRLPGLDGRSLVVTVCDNSSADVIDEGMDHLVNEIQVPAVLASLKPSDLMRAFTNHDEVLYVSPVGRTSAVTELDQANDLETKSIWNLLGVPSDYVDPYVELVALVERYAKNHTMRVPTDDVKLALIVNQSDPQTAELGAQLAPTLSLNGLPAQQNGNLFRVLPIDPSETSIANVAGAILDETFRPDIIVSAAGTPFTQENGVVIQVESQWGAERKPFFVVSPYEAADVAAIRDRITTFLINRVATDLNRRVLGLSLAPPTNPNVQNAFAAALRSEFRASDDREQPDTGNFYDALYYLAYAAYGAGFDEPLTGKRMAAGMERLIGGDGPFPVGASFISSVFGVLDDDRTIALEGTVGPPDFMDGYRHVNGSVFCFETNVPKRLLIENRDVLVYNRQSEMFVQPPEWQPFPCFTNFIGTD